MLPAFADHVTDWLGLFVPTTVAVNCCEPEAVPGVTDTIVTVDAPAVYCVDARTRFDPDRVGARTRFAITPPAQGR